jgi:hypothetical protein
MNVPFITWIDRQARVTLALLALVSAAVLAACGGAIGSGGTGAVSPSVGGGTVTGFGSVIIDGLRFDDRSVPTLAENEPGNAQTAESRLGHRVEVEVDDHGEARTLRVEASVIGAVTSTSITGPQAGSFVVLGQTVTVNANASAGPVTQFGGGYGNALDLQVGDPVEVHGASKTLNNAAVLQATRIEKRPSMPAYLRVSGIVGGLGSSGPNRFVLGALVVDYGSASISPNGAAPSNGAAVVVFAPAAQLTAAAGSMPVLAASKLRIRHSAPANVETTVSGFIGLLDSAKGEFDLGGLKVKYEPSAVQPAGTVLANGLYVRVHGSFAEDGSLLATQVRLRDGRDEPESELKGSIIGFDAATNTFQIRDVAVSAAGAKLEECPSTGLRDGLFVELEGALGPTGVMAKKIACKDEPVGAVIERKGVASAVDPATSSFTLTPSGKAPLAVTWSTLTYFGSVTPQTLSGKTVEVVGTLVNGVLQATKVKVED